MKTFLLSIPNSVKNWSNSLDAKSILCSRSWLVFNGEGIKESFIFRKDGTLIASHNGKVTRAKWEYLAVNGSLLIDNPNDTIYLLRPAYYDDKVLALQVDGTESVALMIGEQHALELALESVERAKLYITNRTEFDNQQRKRKEAEEAKEKARAEAWDKFIEEKVEERMNTPEKQAEIKRLKDRRKWIIPLLVILIIVGLISFGSLFLALDSPYKEICVTIFIASSCISVVLMIYITDTGDAERESLKLNIKRKYPLEDFKM